MVCGLPSLSVTTTVTTLPAGASVVLVMVVVAVLRNQIYLLDTEYCQKLA